LRDSDPTPIALIAFAFLSCKKLKVIIPPPSPLPLKLKPEHRVNRSVFSMISFLCRSSVFLQGITSVMKPSLLSLLLVLLCITAVSPSNERTVYDFDVVDGDGNVISLEEYDHKPVLLIVNVAR